MFEDDDLEIADRALKVLEENRSKFVAALNKSNTEEKPEVGEILVSNGGVVFECFHQNITLRHKFIAVEGKPRLIQYNFVVAHEGEEIAILTLYHQPNGNLTKDVEGKDSVCGHNNTYVAKNLMNEVGKSLLHSCVFAP